MLINYRTFITLLAGIVFEWMTKLGIVDIPYKDVEAMIMTAILILAALFRLYAGRKLFGRKTATPTE